ncbi:hypothetical protein [Ilumatobacter sp.]|uniref:hypothetical protein n=1 Tax=Ilumatobacter sp. TaxID=1967498 RepID=UPI0037503C1A
MLSRLVRCTLAMGVLVTFLAAPSAAATPPPPDNPISENVGSGLIPIPPGCIAPDAADVAFVGKAVAKDFEKVRFEIVQLRAGSASGYAIDGLIDVLYLEDAKFFDVDEEYLVGARFDSGLGGLFSNVRPPEPLFGGNDVIGLNDTDIECPVIDDPVRTLRPDGASVDSGVVTPLFRDKRLLLATLGVPIAIAFAVIIGLVLLRNVWGLVIKSIFELGRAAVTPVPNHTADRVREHRTDVAED